VAGSQVPNHIFVYSLDTNIQFILNWAPIVYRTYNTILNWTNKKYGDSRFPMIQIRRGKS